MSAADTAAKAAFLAALEIIRAANLFGEGGDISADWPAFRDAMDAAIDAATLGSLNIAATLITWSRQHYSRVVL